MPTTSNHEINEKQLFLGAIGNRLPDNVVCPVRCQFCYAKRLSQIVPSIKTIYRSKYTEKTFAKYLGLHTFLREDSSHLNRNESNSYLQWLQKTKDGINYFPTCDFFSLGLTNAQVEQLLKKNTSSVYKIYTTGFRTDPDFIKYLFQRYRKTFRMYLSLVTFDPTIREHLMNPEIDSENLKKICSVMYRSDISIFALNKNQLMQDIQKLNSYIGKTKCRILIAKLYYNKLDNKRVVKYALEAENNFQFIVEDIWSMDKSITDQISFSPNSTIYAYQWRNDLYQLLAECRGTKEEAIICSKGAYETIRSHFADSPMHVVAVDTCFGGNNDSTQGITANAVINSLQLLLAKGAALKEVYLPGSMFPVNGEYDLNGESVEVIQNTFPKIKFSVIDVPMKILNSMVSFDACKAYYDDVNRGSNNEKLLPKQPNSS